MFFIFGFGLKQKHLGSGGSWTCPRCHNYQQSVRIRQFKQFSLFFIPIARWQRRTLEACGICGEAVDG